MKFLKIFAMCVTLIAPSAAISVTVPISSIATISSIQTSDFAIDDSFTFSFDFDDSVPATISNSGNIDRYLHTNALSSLSFGGQSLTPASSQAFASVFTTFDVASYNVAISFDPVNSPVVFNGVTLRSITMSLRGTQLSGDVTSFGENFDVSRNWLVAEGSVGYVDNNTGVNRGAGFTLSSVPAVPLPAGMPLLLGSLAVFGLVRRKRAAA